MNEATSLHFLPPQRKAKKEIDMQEAKAMKALIKKYPGETDLEIVDIPRPVCPDDGVVLKIRTAGICGSDIHY